MEKLIILASSCRCDFSMWIKAIRFFQFRNIQEAELQLQPGLNILIGNNGQGKTNFIEGIFLALTGQTFRFGDNSDLTSIGAETGAVQLEIEASQSDHLKFTLEQGRKSHQINGKRVSAQGLAQKFPVILFSPESLATIKEASGERRDLLDDFLLSCPDLGYQRVIEDYTKILRSKNKVLKAYAEKRVPHDQLDRILDSYEVKFLEMATAVTVHRIHGILRLLRDFQTMAKDLYPISVELSVEYLMSGKNALHYQEAEIFKAIRDRLSELKSAEINLGYSLVGPQKHEISFLINNKDSRTFCSQGQQRALILAFKLAQLMYHRRVYGTVPVLFLDDVLSELDGQSRANLVKLLNMTEGQIFITTTDQYLCRDLKTETQRYIFVENGKFSYL